jgi:hypothetical protein
MTTIATKIKIKQKKKVIQGTSAHLSTYDFRMSVYRRGGKGERIEAKQIEEALSELCKKWAFQEEKGQRLKRLLTEIEECDDEEEKKKKQKEYDEETFNEKEYPEDDEEEQSENTDENPNEDIPGYRHWQGRISLKKRAARLTVLREFVKLLGIPYSECFNYFRPTSNHVHKNGSFNYAMKKLTRVEGTEPYTEKTYEYTKNIWISPDMLYLNPTTMRPYQKYVEEYRHKFPAPRSTLWIATLLFGGIGKSDMRSYIADHGGMSIYYYGDRKETLQSLCSRCMKLETREIHGIVINIPCAMKLEQDFYNLLEEVKDGRYFDSRYGGVERAMRKPPLIVFANQLPEEDRMTEGRFEVYTVNRETYELEKPTIKPKQKDDLLTFEGETFTRKDFSDFLKQRKQSKEKPIKVPTKLPKFV